MTIKCILKNIKAISFLKTIYFNFHYFPIKTAVRIPFVIYRRTKLYRMNGEIIFEAPVCTGMVKFGRRVMGTQDNTYSRTIWDNGGVL